jgi:putative PIN family toxin of toxin-antitoxin system
MLRVVIDTNVLVSAVLSKSGAPAKVLDLWRKHSFIVATSEAAVQEIRRVLDRMSTGRKYVLPSGEVSNLLNLLHEESQIVPGQVNADGTIPQDSSDEKFLAIAIEGSADAIISGDKHLLDLGKYQNIPILTPRQFLEFLEGTSA